jgi:hypothetical protein
MVINNHLSIASVNQYLEKENLTRMPVIKAFHEQGCFHQHLATSRSFLITCLVGRVITAPVCMALDLASLFAHKIGLQTLSRKTLHLAQVARLYSATSVKPLVRTINAPREKDWTDPTEGICAGSSLYFNFMYSKRAQSISNPREAKDVLMQCARLFVEGGGEEAMKLHGFFGKYFGDFDQFSREGGPHSLTLTPDDHRSSLEKGDIFYRNHADINKLAKGPHLLRMHNGSGYHAMSLIKLSEDHYFIFDPARGLMEFNGNDISEQIVRFLNTEYRFSHRYNYLRVLRRMNAIQEDQPIKASELQEMYIQILPMFSDSNLPTFRSVNLTSIVERDKDSCRRYRIGCLQYLWGLLVDSIKAR